MILSPLMRSFKISGEGGGGNPLNYDEYEKSAIGGLILGVTKFSQMVPFLFYFSALFSNKSYLLASKSQQGAKFLGDLTPLSPLGGYIKSKIGGLILRWFRRVAPPPPPNNQTPF